MKRLLFLILAFCLLVLFVLFVPAALNPTSTTAVINLVAVPSAILLPFLLVRIHRIPASILYLILIAAAVTNLLLQ